MARLKDRPDEENEKEIELLNRAKPVHIFYSVYGKALSCKGSEDLSGKWEGPDCELLITHKGTEFIARGRYEVPPSPLASLFSVSSFGSAKLKPTSYLIEYKGSVEGFAIEARVSRKEEDGINSALEAIYKPDGGTPVLMVLADGKNELNVMEKGQGSTERFYVFKRKQKN